MCPAGTANRCCSGTRASHAGGVCVCVSPTPDATLSLRVLGSFFPLLQDKSEYSPSGNTNVEMGMVTEEMPG